MVSESADRKETSRETNAWLEPVDLALRHADIATKLVQFFIVASVAVGGWVAASEGIRQSPVLSSDRLVWACLYSLMSLPIWLALLDLQRRINACYAMARMSMPETGSGLARDFDTRLVAIGFPIFVLVVDLIILFAN